MFVVCSTLSVARRRKFARHAACEDIGLALLDALRGRPPDHVGCHTSRAMRGRIWRNNGPVKSLGERLLGIREMAADK